MDATCGQRQVRKVEICFVGRIHFSSVWIGDADGFGGDTFVADSGIHGAEVGCATGVGNRNGVWWDNGGCGGTYGN